MALEIEGKVIMLNALFVCKYFSQQGVAKNLINSVVSYAKASKAIRVDLSTAKENHNVQSLYEKIGFEKGNDYFSYSLSVK